MKYQVWPVLAALIMTSFTAFAGPNDGGGGDTLANEFLEAGGVVKGLLDAHSVSGVSESGSDFGVWLTRIEKSLDGKKPILTFPDGRTLSCFGETKVGCVDDSGKIKIARQSFEKLGTSDRYELVALEIFKLMNVTDRYPKARKVSDFTRAQTQTIESHVQFMVRYQISTFSLKYNGNDITLATCTNVGRTIERLDILTELVQLLVLEGKWELPMLRTAQALETSARNLYPYCGINTADKNLPKFPDAVTALEQAMVKMKAAVGPAPALNDGAPAKSSLPLGASAAPLVKTPKPGLNEGQWFNLKTDLLLPGTNGGQMGWNYFVNGRRVDAAVLSKHEGMQFCAVNNTDGLMPAALIQNGVRRIPAGPMQLTEISWYVDTVFLDAKTPAGKVGIVIACGTVTDGDLDKNEMTSLTAIQTHFAGILESR